ncbi:tripartite tricarboxylate transporter substrate binding protein [Bordetella sp. 15P40C-2]|uniref:Bug family tripartite tricarboxylate transporter substrate binding protein n=1 Tax=Bordetella sp. 15P40C-2 TaxID=2572246 RepID=UPI0013226BD5|nr:tripartite tricarboxylate transporter substrate binding protein [Bordetella sp. 15P40C-2]MVW72897.1 tripartite tricarboxylate transporter substrate binding protein [Bordetella sp. 15P40C-2]
MTRTLALSNVVRFIATAALAVTAGLAHAQQPWPGKTLTLIVPYTAGGTNDTLGRTLGEILRRDYGTATIVENKPGAGGSVGADAVARAMPDGNTLLLASTSPLTIFPNLVKTSYDPMKDLVPVASVAVGPVGILATKATPVSTFEQLVEEAKKRPGKITFGVPGLGSVAHIGMAALSKELGIEMLQVPYRGGSQAVSDGLGGQVDLLVVNTDIVLPHVAAGTLKPLAVMAPKRLAPWPDVPTMAELNLPDIRYFSNFALFAPAGVPAPVMQSMHEVITKALADPQFQQMLEKQSMQPGTGVGDDFVKQVRESYEQNGRIIREGNITAQ